MQLLSNAHREATINGEPVEKLADVDRPIEYTMGGDDRFNLKTGRDGGMYGEYLGQLGDMVMYRVEPTSPTAQRMIIVNEMNKMAGMEGSEFVTMEGTDDDPVQGRTTQLMGGLLQQCPTQIEPGVDFEFGIKYEQVVSDVEGATFMPLLESASA